MKALLLITLSFLSVFSYGQSTIRFSQLNFSQAVYNPAAIAIDGEIMVDMIARNQWFGFEGAPTTLALAAQYEIVEDMAVGLNVFHDRIGVAQTTSIQGQYSYRLFTNYTDALIFGIGAGVDNYILDYQSSTVIEDLDPMFMNYYSRLMFNASLGLYYYTPTWYAGFSTPNIFSPQFDLTSGVGKIKPFPHYYLNAGVYIDAGANYTLNPHLQVKVTRGAPVAGDLIIRNTFQGRWSFVVGYRTENSIIAGLDFLITPYCRAGYSFNYDVGKLARTKGMSNEIYLGIAFPYRNDRNDFGERRYVNNKGGWKREYRRKTNHKNQTRFTTWK